MLFFDEEWPTEIYAAHGNADTDDERASIAAAFLRDIAERGFDAVWADEDE